MCCQVSNERYSCAGRHDVTYMSSEDAASEALEKRGSDSVACELGGLRGLGGSGSEDRLSNIL